MLETFLAIVLLMGILWVLTATQWGRMVFLCLIAITALGALKVYHESVPYDSRVAYSESGVQLVPSAVAVPNKEIPDACVARADPDPDIVLGRAVICEILLGH